MQIVIAKEGIWVSQATKSGFIFCKWGGCFDMAYPNSKLRRGRVQGNGDICPAITSEGLTLFVVEKDG